MVFGALAGGITNAIAVWMLFHPYEPPRLFGRPVRFLQGAIPKNKARLASSMGRTVGNKLLTPDDLARTVNEPAFRTAFDERLASFVRDVFDRRMGPVSSMLAPDVVAQVRVLLDEVATSQIERLNEYLAGDEFRVKAVDMAARLADELSTQTLAGVLTEEREEALATLAQEWIADTVEGEGFEVTVRDQVERGAERLLVPGRTFQDILPIGLVASVERAISGYMPIAIEKLAGLLEDPDAKRRVKRVLHELLDRFMRDLKFHQRIVASLIITPETIDRVLLAVEEEGASKIAELLNDNAVRDAIARSVNNAIVDFLGRPVTSVLGGTGDASVVEARDTLADWLLRLAREQQTRTFLVDRLRATLDAAERQTWGDVFRRIPPDRVADAIVAAARSERAREFYQDAAHRLVTIVLERPIGRIGDHVPEDAPERVEKALAGPLWSWIQEQIPPIAQRIDIAARVQSKILEFPTQQVEALIKGVTERELQLIVRLGYVLGAMIGLISAAISILI
jgi:uncharacterized membrane protein YheB (UPF0754 family)